MAMETRLGEGSFPSAIEQAAADRRMVEQRLGVVPRPPLNPALVLELQDLLDEQERKGLGFKVVELAPDDTSVIDRYVGIASQKDRMRDGQGRAWESGRSPQPGAICVWSHMIVLQQELPPTL